MIFEFLNDILKPIQDDINAGIAQPESSKTSQPVKRKTYGTGIGKYINKGASTSKASIDDMTVTDEPVNKKKKKTKTSLNDFSEW